MAQALIKKTTLAETMNPTSITDVIKSRGGDPSFSSRKEMAKKYGIYDYSGTASQNVTLLNRLKQSTSTTVNDSTSTTAPTPNIPIPEIQNMGVYSPSIDKKGETYGPYQPVAGPPTPPGVGLTTQEGTPMIGQYTFGNQLTQSAKDINAVAMKSIYDEALMNNKSPEEAMASMIAADMTIGSDITKPDFTTPKLPDINDPALMASVQDRELALKNKEEATKNSQQFLGQLQKRYDTTLKKSMDTLANLAGNESYMNWLGTLGISPNSLLSLAKGREGYINEFVNNVKTNLNNDVVYLQNLKQIKSEAESDFISKSRIVNEEIKRVQSQKDELLYTADDGQGNLTMFWRKADGTRYNEKVAGVSKKQAKNYTKITSNGVDYYIDQDTGELFDPATVVNEQSQSNQISGITSGVDTGTSYIDVYKNLGLKRTGEQQYIGQCGAFVNDVLGTPGRYGTSLADKKRNLNNFNITDPKAGSVFVSTIGNAEQGHTGFVESVDKQNGTVTLVDMNRKGDKTFSRRVVNISDLASKESIIGYENRVISSKGDTTSSSNIDPESGSILKQTGLSLPAFNYLTGNSSAMTRMTATQRQKYINEAQDFANKTGTDVSTVQAQYKAYNETLQKNIERFNNVRLAESEVLGTVDLLSEVSVIAKFSDLKVENVIKLLAGQELNDPTALAYKFHLEQLRNEIALYAAATRGSNTAELVDVSAANTTIMSGISSGSLEGLRKAVENSVLKMDANLKNAIDRSKAGVWKIFGLTPPVEKTPTKPVKQATIKDVVRDPISTFFNAVKQFAPVVSNTIKGLSQNIDQQSIKDFSGTTRGEAISFLKQNGINDYTEDDINFLLNQ